MKIVMMTNTYLPHVGGVAQSVHRCAEWLRAVGHSVLIIAPTFAGAGPGAHPGAKATEPGVVRVAALHNLSGSSFSMPLPLTGPLHRAIDGFRPDLVHTHHPFLLGDTALRVGAQFEIPVVYTHHTMYERYTQHFPLDSKRTRRFARELATGYANLCDSVVAPSESARDTMKARGVRVAIHVVPTGVDVAQFEAGRGDRFRHTHDIPPDAWVVGHVGRLAPEKNLAFLTQCLIEHARQDAEVHLLIVGDGPEAARISRRFDEAGLRDRLHMPGPLRGTGLADAYAAMNAFGFASQSETQGLVLTEAMSAGVPVVAVEAPGVREVLRDGVNGRMLRRESIETFAGALAGIRNPEESEELVRGARATARAYSIESTCARLLRVYREAENIFQNRRERSGMAWSTHRRRLHEEWLLAAHRVQTFGDAWSSTSVRS